VVKLFYVVAVDMAIIVKIRNVHCIFKQYFNTAVCNKWTNLIIYKCGKLR